MFGTGRGAEYLSSCLWLVPLSGVRENGSTMLLERIFVFSPNWNLKFQCLEGSVVILNQNFYDGMSFKNSLNYLYKIKAPLY